jgi:predicted dinucleotide-binding enzyme
MEKIKSIDLCVIGAGRVGITVCYTIAMKNLSDAKVKAISSRSVESLKKAKKFLGTRAADIIFTEDNTKAAALANCILICTPDDSIKAVCDSIFKNKKNNYLKDYYVFHFSGSKSLSVLEPKPHQYIR